MKVYNCFLQKAERYGAIKSKTAIIPKGYEVKHFSLWEPDYLVLAKTKTPEYDEINVQIKGFDFAVLEKFQSLIHRIAKQMSIDVTASWAFPYQHLKVQTFYENSSQIKTEYKLKLYERNVQIIDAKSHIMPLFLETLITACPPGVKISVHEHTKEIEDAKYVPDYDAIELQKQVDEIEAKKKKK
ncbi:mitochondrial 50S ribosomal protein 48, putative [Pediculus humanus corporis]|uniref:Mitochondrial 50S ribosomal protein 48, putative n=1 Tax=Pediculus humanus subsp. corporis TaxID=121224 RepID=E0VR38_PEDHC|nr:mitochondrial 50S ribosomal protein 48, putative [Pediculus humanus corporis]EEB15844.1 mitochondrial 50S ribosomal protein 48, putative [Pediculus humanus corporis]